TIMVPAFGTRGLVHTPYLESNNTYYRISSSVLYHVDIMVSDFEIASISCIDVGPKHTACTEPWTIGGIRKGNSFKCQKGFYLHTLKNLDHSGQEQSIGGDLYDMKSMQCQKDGW
ncbi:hypothetical protein PENTCL1PPCAC_4499, partial [Pristionchus entomophagus]